MIVFQFDTETYVDNAKYERPLYWLCTTDVTGIDAVHKAEIYEQLDAQQSGLDEVSE